MRPQDMRDIDELGGTRPMTDVPRIRDTNLTIVRIMTQASEY